VKLLSISLTAHVKPAHYKSSKSLSIVFELFRVTRRKRGWELLCTLSATLLVSYGEDPAEFRNDLPQETLDLERPYGMSLDGSLLA
jgi:hypothetical protein